MMRDLTLSVLDQSPIRKGGTAARALQETVELAGVVERLGYKRYWVAEHHNTGSFAGTAPEILIGQIAAHTSAIRVGSGGVMLSHYSALKVAETFSMLSAFYPGRIDVGIGRAPGSDRKTAAALAYPRAMGDLNAFAGIEAQAGPPLSASETPDVWLLGSSDYSARLAAALGLPFAFADFFGNAGDIGPRVAELYRRGFQPSERLQTPKLTVAVHVICADSDERAHYIASSMRVAVAHLRTGAGGAPLLPPNEASSDDMAAAGGDFVAGFTRHFIEGSPETVRRQFVDVAERYETDDVTIATNCYAFEDRLRSYQLVAEAFAPASSAAR